jgi:hypothetical protein
MTKIFPDTTFHLPQLLDVDFFNNWAVEHIWHGRIWHNGAVYKPDSPQEAMLEYFQTPLSVWGGIGDINYRLAAKHFVAKQIETAYSQYIAERLGVPKEWNMQTKLRIPQAQAA